LEILLVSEQGRGWEVDLWLAVLLAVAVGLALGVHTARGPRFQVGPMALSVVGTWVCFQIVLWTESRVLRSNTFPPLAQIIFWTLVLMPLHVLFALPAAASCALVQGIGPRSGGGVMSILRAFLTIIASAIGFGLGGWLIGYMLGTNAPGYYRSVFRNGSDPAFDPVAVGAGLGLTQGIVAGLIVGAVVVLAVAWYRSRVPERDRQEPRRMSRDLLQRWKPPPEEPEKEQITDRPR
jgi:hypothetical protein